MTIFWCCSDRAVTFFTLQTFVWLAAEAAALDSLVVATPTRFDRLPAVSSLLGSGSGASLAQRLGTPCSSKNTAPTHYPPSPRSTEDWPLYSRVLQLATRDTRVYSRVRACSSGHSPLSRPLPKSMCSDF